MQPNRSRKPLFRPSALLLDLDGTLTVARLDFPRMKRELGIGDQPILEAMAAMTPEARAAAARVVERHETEAAENSELATGAAELFDWLDRRGMGFAIVTRNSGQCLAATRAKHSLPPCVCISRDDARFKPDPESLLVACERLGVGPDRAWMAGDGRFDVEAARAANIFSVWITRGRSERPFDAVPDRTVADLHGLVALLERASGTDPAPGGGSLADHGEAEAL